MGNTRETLLRIENARLRKELRRLEYEENRRKNGIAFLLKEHESLVTTYNDLRNCLLTLEEENTVLRSYLGLEEHRKRIEREFSFLFN